MRLQRSGGGGGGRGGVELRQRQLLISVDFRFIFRKSLCTFRAIFRNRMLVFKNGHTLHSCCSREPAILDDSGLKHHGISPATAKKKRQMMGSKGAKGLLAARECDAKTSPHFQRSRVSHL